MGGGSELSTLNFAQRILALGHYVHIVTSRDEKIQSESVEAGIHLPQLQAHWQNSWL